MVFLLFALTQIVLLQSYPIKDSILYALSGLVICLTKILEDINLLSSLSNSQRLVRYIFLGELRKKDQVDMLINVVDPPTFSG